MLLMASFGFPVPLKRTRGSIGREKHGGGEKEGHTLSLGILNSTCHGSGAQRKRLGGDSDCPPPLFLLVIFSSQLYLA